MTDTATATPEAPAAKRAGPKMCSKCGEHRQVGGKEEEMGKMSELCLSCATASIRSGRCPLCGFSFSSKTHAKCLDINRTPEPSEV